MQRNFIATLTFNPCIDKSTAVENVIPDKKLKCAQPKFEPGGGGINVARAITRLGGYAIAIYPFGGYSGRFLNELLLHDNVTIRAFPIQDHTRENLVVFDKTSGAQYKFGMPGPQLSEPEAASLVHLARHARGTYLVISGSMQQNLQPALLKHLLEPLEEHERKVIIDSSGPIMEQMLDAHVFLIKPNLNELGTLCREVATVNNAPALARKLMQQKRVQNIVVSMGADGALLVTNEETVHFEAPKVSIKSTVGAGDSMLAGIVLKVSEGWPLREACRYGVACGSAATLNPGTELCSLADVTSLFESVNVHAG